MEIILKRIAKRATYTIGRLYILSDGSVERELIPGRRREDKRTVRCRVDESLLTTEHYFCDTLEPTWRNLLGIPLAPREVDARHGRVSGKMARKVQGKTAIPRRLLHRGGEQVATIQEMVAPTRGRAPL